jgi:hypothetical protein
VDEFELVDATRTARNREVRGAAAVRLWRWLVLHRCWLVHWLLVLHWSRLVVLHWRLLMHWLVDWLVHWLRRTARWLACNVDLDKVLLVRFSHR